MAIKMSEEEPIALKEVQLRLGVPQHVLIHLCEKGVVEPDFADTSGRGKRRGFSRRNVFEFAVALALRRFELPVVTTALVVRVVRSFARAVNKVAPWFTVPDSLLERKVELALHLYDGERLVLTVSGSAFRTPLILGASIPDPTRTTEASVRVMRLDRLPEKYEARLDVDLSEIARRATRTTLLQ